MEHVGKALVNPYPVFEATKLSPGMRVADLGCGRTGHFVFPASRVVGDTGLVYAVDIIKDIIQSIQSRARSEGCENVQTMWGDIERYGALPIPGGTVDVCFLVNVMFMLKNRVQTFKEMKRILKSGGFAAVVDWEKRLGPLGPTDQQMVDTEALSALAAQEGFERLAKIPVGDYHFAVIYKTK